MKNEKEYNNEISYENNNNNKTLKSEQDINSYLSEVY